MTTLHMIDGLHQATKSANDRQLAKILGIDCTTISNIRHGRRDGVNMQTVMRMQAGSGVSFDTIFAWFALPADAVLGRIPAALVRP